MDAQPVQSRVHPGGSKTQEWSEGKRGTVKMEEEEEDEKEGSPSIKSGLWIDGKTSEKVKAVKKHGKCVFTTTQLHELQLQMLVLKYIAGGIQVPVSLVIPIWKSVATPVASAHGGVYQRYPRFVGVSPQAIDYQNMVDPEPGRCRRTDGKKWRCSKDVIPYQKYCLQHMHRGCRRSRKPVETSQTALPDSTMSKFSMENSKNLSAPVSSQYMNQSSCNTSTRHETPATTAIGNGYLNTISAHATPSTSSTIITATKKDDKNDSERIKNDMNAGEKCEEKLSVSDGNIINRSCKSVNKVTVAYNKSPSVGFSPKSVLQVLGNTSSRVYKNEIEGEPRRCRRTDGKRWRCSRDVIPDQKYCARHMHRGARKHAKVSQPISVPTIGDSRPSRLTIANKATCPALSTSLSISVPIRPLITRDKESMSSSSETTISDTTVTVFNNGNL